VSGPFFGGPEKGPDTNGTSAQGKAHSERLAEP